MTAQPATAEPSCHERSSVGPAEFWQRYRVFEAHGIDLARVHGYYAKMRYFYADLPLHRSGMKTIMGALPREAAPGRRALILGTGCGTTQFLFHEWFGFDTYGIDVREPIAPAAYARMTAECGALDDRPFRVYHGNFFPRDFSVPRRVRWLDHTPDSDLLATAPFAAMGLTLADFDMVYSYQYDLNTPAVLRLVSERCMPGTTALIAYAHEQPTPSNMVRRAFAAPFEVYTVLEPSSLVMRWWDQNRRFWLAKPA